MSRKLTARAAQILAMAADEARGFNHEYIGTEHLLLAIAVDTSSDASDVLKSFGVDVAGVRAAIESLVQRGPASVAVEHLPLTPRAEAAIEFAYEEAITVGQKFVDSEHLLLGLMREPDGVASRVLRSLGIKPEELRTEALKTRIALMKIVERAVRPLHASTIRKRKMREELLAHLTSIYDQELRRTNDRAVAFEQAARRFGDPAELAREFEDALPWHERISHFMERFVLYRAPETAARFSMRMALHTFVLLTVVLGLVQGFIALRYGWGADVRTLARVLAAIVLLTPPVQFVVWLAYIKMRDALWGAFNNRKSLARVLALDAIIAIAGALYLLGITAVTRMDLGRTLEAARTCGVIGLFAAIWLLILARFSGPYEIRDTHWALLDIEAA